MISFHRSRPLIETTMTAHESEGWSAAPAPSQSLTTMDALPGVPVLVILPSLIIKSWTMKKLLTATKSNSQLGGTNTRHRMSKQDLSASRTTNARVRIRSWRISSSSSTTFQYEITLTPVCSRDV